MDLLAADEVFITGTGARMVPVASLDGVPIGEPGKRPVFERIAAAFPAFAHQHGTPL
jgi:branched-chain amino acid aminotransferase